jgi:Uma2 family endonuclease
MTTTDQPTDQAKFTRADYMALPEELRAELLDGILLRKPTPTPWHQVIVGKLLVQLTDLAGPNRVVPSPIDVFVDDHNILQGDLLVLAESDAARPGDRHAPTPILVIEVLSPETADRDRDEKVGIYLRAGVKEVWLVDPDAATGEIYRSDGCETFDRASSPGSRVVAGFSLDLTRLLELE